MSEAVSVLAGAKFSGAVTVCDAGLKGMITVRGDLTSEKMGAAIKAATGMSVPKPRKISQGKKGAVAWMSPDELLLIVEYEAADATVAKINKALAKEHCLVVNVSDARAFLTLEGVGVREVIAKGAPADLSPEGLGLGEIRRTRIGQLAAAFWLSDAQTMHVVCFRSVGEHVFNWLCVAAEDGSLPEFI
jgi:sarcosine oxidase, subunit gamma